MAGSENLAVKKRQRVCLSGELSLPAVRWRAVQVRFADLILGGRVQHSACLCVTHSSSSAVPSVEVYLPTADQIRSDQISPPAALHIKLRTACTASHSTASAQKLKLAVR